MKKLEHISPDSRLLGELKKRAAELDETIKSGTLALNTAPRGRLRIHQGKYFLLLPGERPRYLRKSEITLIRSLAQKTYDRAIMQRLKLELILNQKHMKLIQSRPVSALFARYSPARQTLVEPVTLSDAAYAERWRTVRYQHMSFNEEDQPLYTASGIRMRSKSELLIAEQLEKSGIPYRYEYPLEVAMPDGSKKHFRPDFYCLEPETRREFVWEHFGRMDDTAYRIRAEDKMEMYVFSGVFNERNFIATFEEKEHPLNIAEVTSKLTQFLETLKKGGV